MLQRSNTRLVRSNTLHKDGLTLQTAGAIDQHGRMRKASAQRTATLSARRASLLSPDVPLKLMQTAVQAAGVGNPEQRTLDHLAGMTKFQATRHDKASELVQDTVSKQKIEAQSRSIEHVELGYFMKQSRQRLVQVKSGVKLFKAIDIQREKNMEPLRKLETAIELARGSKNADGRSDSGGRAGYEAESPSPLPRSKTLAGPLSRNDATDSPSCATPLAASATHLPVRRILKKSGTQTALASSPALTRAGKLVIKEPPKWSIEQYYGQQKFDPEAEVEKEHHIDDFFYQKYKRVENYLIKAEEDAEAASKRAKSSYKNFGITLQKPVAPGRDENLGRKTPITTRATKGGNLLSQRKDAASRAGKKPGAPLAPGLEKEKDAYLRGLVELQETMERTQQQNKLMERAKMSGLDKEARAAKLLETGDAQTRRKGENGLLYALRLINYVQENEREKMAQEIEAREEEKKDKRLKKALLDEQQRLIFKKQQRQAYMPMHRALPDFVEKNHLRTNFYDDEKNAPAIVEGLKFMNKIDPELIRSIPLARGVLHDALRKEQRRAAQKSKRINVFALEDDE